MISLKKILKTSVLYVAAAIIFGSFSLIGSPNALSKEVVFDEEMQPASYQVIYLEGAENVEREDEVLYIAGDEIDEEELYNLVEDKKLVVIFQRGEQ